MRGLWTWAVEAYARPGVSETCLGLQDLHDQNVCLLLWAAWTASDGRPLDDDAVEAAVDTARAWDDSAIAPLRAIRRRLKAAIPDIGDDDRLAMRQQVKALELDGERRLLLALERLSPDQKGQALPCLPALARVSRAWSPVTPRAALETLCARLSA